MAGQAVVTSVAPADALPRLALVTGASRGIGRSIVEHLKAAHYQVAAIARSWPSDCEHDDEFLNITCDVRDRNQVEHAFDKAETCFGKPVSVLVNNAGTTCDRLLAYLSDEDWSDIMATNLTAAMITMRRAVRSMLAQQYGRVINVGSIAGLTGNVGQTAYAAAKAGLVGLTKAFARETARRNITANVVAPAFVVTDMTAVMPQRIQKAAVGAAPPGRMARVDEVAAAVVFLASPEASYISGSVLPVDGGLT